jgi:hypothetical protein
MLRCRNNDTPSVIGQVRTLLGINQINIANFALGRGKIITPSNLNIECR